MFNFPGWTALSIGVVNLHIWKLWLCGESFGGAGEVSAKWERLWLSGGSFPAQPMFYCVVEALAEQGKFQLSGESSSQAGSFSGAGEALAKWGKVWMSCRSFDWVGDILARQGKLWLSKESFGWAGKALAKWRKLQMSSESFSYLDKVTVQQRLWQSGTLGPSGASFSCAGKGACGQKNLQTDGRNELHCVVWYLYAAEDVEINY